MVIDCGQIVVKLCYLFMLLFIEFHFFAKFNSFQLNQFFVLQYRRKKSLKNIFLGRLSLSDCSMIFYIKISSITVKWTDGRCHNFCTFWFLILQLQVHKCLVLETYSVALTWIFSLLIRYICSIFDSCYICDFANCMCNLFLCIKSMVLLCGLCD